MNALMSWGWCAFFSNQLTAHEKENLLPARVIQEEKNLRRVLSPRGESWAVIAGRLRHAIDCKLALPAVGDWVLIEARADAERAVIHRILERRSALVRKQPGAEVDAQVLAANVDRVLLVDAVQDALNLRRLERYLVLAWESGAIPIVVLTKLDLCADSETVMALARAAAPGAEVFGVSALEDHGVGDLCAALPPQQTAVVLGPSGVGKSTLINALVQRNSLRTGAVRTSDGRGRHTTTSRQLLPLANGSLIIDTPGLREIQLWEGEEGMGSAFADVEAQSIHCRFRDCRHDREPGCAVQAAIESGALDADRFQNYRKLQKELQYQERKHDKAALSEQRKGWKRITAALRRDTRDGYK